MSFLFLILIPVIWLSEWFVKQHQKNSNSSEELFNNKAHPYWLGIHFLLDEQPDKAVDVFIKLLEVDSDTVETHLALGNLFRKRGEVERAIRIHQNLIARPNLTPLYKTHALLALGQDYMYAGMLDRAERIFLEVVEHGLEKILGLKYLSDLYQREKAWEKAIDNALKLQTISEIRLNVAISHYYCELAVNCLVHDRQKAEDFLYKALSFDHNNARASMCLGQLFIDMQDYKKAIKILQQVKSQNPDFLSEALKPLAVCYDALNKRSDFIRFLKECLKEHARISVVLILTDYVIQEYNIQAGIDLLTDYLHMHPSLRGLQRLIELQLQTFKNEPNENLNILRHFTEKMLENKPIYRCCNCGFGAKTLDWLCPGCRQWNTIRPIHGLEGD